MPPRSRSRSRGAVDRAGPRAVVISGAFVDVDLAFAPTVLAARGRIAAAVGVPIGRVQLVDTSALTQIDDAAGFLRISRLWF